MGLRQNMSQRRGLVIGDQELEKAKSKAISRRDRRGRRENLIKQNDFKKFSAPSVGSSE